jgi:hypothetical protein
MTRDCIFSPCRKFRYTLFRTWRDLIDSREGFVNWLLLNPSTATDSIDDPTIRRCMGFTKAWGRTEMCVTNIFAFRATDPKDMLRHPNPVGDDNDGIIFDIARKADLVVCAWGTHGTHLGRNAQVLNLLHKARVKPHCLRLTDSGHPQHPLYLPAHLKPIPL